MNRYFQQSVGPFSTLHNLFLQFPSFHAPFPLHHPWLPNTQRQHLVPDLSMAAVLFPVLISVTLNPQQNLTKQYIATNI